MPYVKCTPKVFCLTFGVHFTYGLMFFILIWLGCYLSIYCSPTPDAFIFHTTAPHGAIPVWNGSVAERILFLRRLLINSVAIYFPSLIPNMSIAN